MAACVARTQEGYPNSLDWILGWCLLWSYSWYMLTEFPVINKPTYLTKDNNSTGGNKHTGGVFLLKINNRIVPNKCI